MNARLVLLAAAVSLATACPSVQPPAPGPEPRGPTPPYVPDPRFVKAAPAPTPVAAAPAPAVPEGERLFAKSGCGGCHAKGAPFHEKLAGAKGKSDQTVAAWILNPKAVKPDTVMPPYGQTLSREQALTLARWVLEGGPVGAPK